jgi:pilus assembly protein Flp/PilA
VPGAHYPSRDQFQSNKQETGMRGISTTVARWLRVDSEQGVTAIEYGLIASLIAIAIIVGITLVGTNLNGLFNYIGGKVAAP